MILCSLIIRAREHPQRRGEVSPPAPQWAPLPTSLMDEQSAAVRSEYNYYQVVISKGFLGV